MAVLKTYKNLNINFFGDGEWEQPVELTIEKTYFFGLIRRQKKTTYIIPMFGNLKQHYDYWDKLIEDKTPF